MIDYFHRFKTYLSYWLNAVNQHSLQAPFVYDIYSKVFNNKKREKYDYSKINAVRRRLEHSNHTVEVIDLGAGSTVGNSSKRSVSDIAKNGVTQKKYGELLHRLVAYTEAKNVLELGTSLGISTLYLASTPQSTVTTIEGSENLLNIAEAVFEGQQMDNIKTVSGDIKDVLAGVLSQYNKLDFVYFDANHTKHATLSYFSQCLKKAHDTTCFVFDDIHWSKDMEEAWEAIKQDYNVTLTIDIYQMGIVFINPEIIKQHYVLEF